MNKSKLIGSTGLFQSIPGSLSESLSNTDYLTFLKNMGLDAKYLKSRGKLDNPKFMNDLIYGKGDFEEIGGIIDFLKEEDIEIEMMNLPRYKGYTNWDDYFKREDEVINIFGLMYDIFNLINKGGMKRNKLSGEVLERFQKYKKECDLSNIHYGKDAIEKMASVFHPEDKTSRNKWIKRMKHKSDNCVYFVYNHKRKGKSHRFLAPNSDLGEQIDIPKRKKSFKRRKSVTYRKSHRRGNRRRSKRSRKVQKGGVLPALCIPCWAGPAVGAASLGTAGYMISKSSSSSNMNGKKTLKRKETYKMKKNGKQMKKEFEQKNNRIYLNGKEIKPRQNDINEATKQLNKKIKECIESGFKKC